MRKIDLDVNGKMALVEYLIFKYNKGLEATINSPQGDNRKEIEEAQEKFEEVSKALSDLQERLSEQERAVREQKESLESQKRALAEQKRTEEEAKKALDEQMRAEEAARFILIIFFNITVELL